MGEIINITIQGMTQIGIILALYFVFLLFCRERYNIAKVSVSIFAALVMLGGLMNGNISAMFIYGIAIIIINVHAHYKIKRLGALSEFKKDDKKRESSTQEKIVYSTCGWCEKNFVNKENIAECSICHRIYHVSCVEKKKRCKCGATEMIIKYKK